jgi:hypothetical protein
MVWRAHRWNSHAGVRRTDRDVGVKRLDARIPSTSPWVMDDRAKPPKAPKPPSDREARLAKALRANLKRRKAPAAPKTAPESN